MGMFSRRHIDNPAGRVVRQVAPDESALQPYRIKGIYAPEERSHNDEHGVKVVDRPLLKDKDGKEIPAGTFIVPDRTMIELRGGRHAEKPGDVLWMDRGEAAVVGKHFVLSPLTRDEV